MPALDFKTLVKELRTQNWAVSQSNSGHWRCTPPDPKQAIVHLSESGDYRAIRNSLADLKRSGFVWEERGRRGPALEQGTPMEVEQLLDVLSKEPPVAFRPGASDSRWLRPSFVTNLLLMSKTKRSLM
jgi:hypothetical protein